MRSAPAWRNAEPLPAARGAAQDSTKRPGHRGLVGRLVEQRHVQEQRQLAARPGLLAASTIALSLLIGGNRKIACPPSSCALMASRARSPGTSIACPEVGRRNARGSSGAPLIGDHGRTMRGEILDCRRDRGCRAGSARAGRSPRAALALLKGRSPWTRRRARISPEFSTRSGRMARSASPMRSKLPTKKGFSALSVRVGLIWAQCERSNDSSPRLNEGTQSTSRFATAWAPLAPDDSGCCARGWKAVVAGQKDMPSMGARTLPLPRRRNW